MADSWDEKSVFLHALGLEASEREAYLARACPDAPSRRRIDALLRHHVDSAAPTALPEGPDAPAPSAAAPGVPGVPVFGGRGAPDAPTRIDEFTIVREIGRGGMGVVYLATDEILGRPVALKVVAAHLIDSESALGRFRLEARSAAAVAHPAIVPVFKLGSSGDRAYIASEFVDGPTLAAEIAAETSRRTTASTADLRTWQRHVATVGATVADALDACHRARIVHRDVKPSNILIDPARGARLADFGVAKRLPAREALATATELVGTFHYMSPEQARILEIDHRSDVFSLGVVLYEALALRRPFEGSDRLQVLHAVCEEEPPRLRTAAPRIPRDLETIVHKAIEKHPSERYQSAAHVAADLRCWLEDREILARPPGTMRRIRRRVRRHRRGAALAIAVAGVVALGAMGSVLLRGRDAQVAFVDVDAPPGAAVVAQRVVARTLELEPTAHALGIAPIGGLRLEPGHYRITVVAAVGSGWVEFDLPLLRTGPGEGTTLHAVTDPAAVRPGSASERWGVLRAAVEIADGEMVSVEAGRHSLGRHDDSDPLLALRTVELPDFLIDRTEVSNREYREFMAATGQPPPRTWEGGEPPSGLEARPVTGVTMEEAAAFARWRGKRLPSALEWEAAVRGPRALRFPWDGAAPDEAAALGAALEPAAELALAMQGDGAELLRLYARFTVATDSPDPLAARLSGLAHAFGNVREITATIDLASSAVVLKGRGWSDAVSRHDLSAVWTSPHGAAIDHGFRCAKSAQPPAPAGRTE